MTKGEAIFSMRYAGSVGYYAAMLHYKSILLDVSEPFCKKNKHLNRMDIIGPNGVQSLSVPLSKPNTSMTVGEIEISEHANWRHNHWGALFSAYGRTPFFDYFADDLKTLYDDISIHSIAVFNRMLHERIVEFLDLPVATMITDGNRLSPDVADLRNEKLAQKGEKDCPVAYYQIWQSKHGFVADLSILDLLFNQGREAIFTLLKHGIQL